MSSQQSKEPVFAAPAACHQLLTFILGDEDYGVDILRVQEIRGWAAVTKIPHTLPDVLGVLNLRGSVVPVVDLRLRFELARAEYNAMTVIIVLTVQSAAGTQEVGVVVDGVKEVVDVDAALLRPAPNLGFHAHKWISALLANGESMVVILDVDGLIGSQGSESVLAA